MFASCVLQPADYHGMSLIKLEIRVEISKHSSTLQVLMPTL